MKFTLIFVCLTALLEGKVADSQASNNSVSQDSEIPSTAASSFTANTDSSDVPAKLAGSSSTSQDDNLGSYSDSAKPSSLIKNEVPSNSTENISSAQDDDSASSSGVDSPINVEVDAPTNPSATPIVNSKAICGKDAGGKTCEGNSYGPCCSEFGFCGSSPFFCHSSANCQSGCKDEPLTYSANQFCGKLNKGLPCAPNGPYGSCCNDEGYCGNSEDHCKAKQPTLQR